MLKVSIAPLGSFHYPASCSGGGGGLCVFCTLTVHCSNDQVESKLATDSNKTNAKKRASASVFISLQAFLRWAYLFRLERFYVEWFSCRKRFVLFTRKFWFVVFFLAPVSIPSPRKKKSDFLFEAKTYFSWKNNPSFIFGKLFLQAQHKTFLAYNKFSLCV